MKGYSFRSLTDLVLKIFKTKVNAGTGLSGGGSLEADRTLTVNYGTTAGTATQGNDSRVVNAASNATVNAKEAALETKKADKAITITAGTGLSGGGTLATNRTLTVNYGTIAGTATQGNDSRLSNSREWSAGTIGQAEVEAGSATTRRAFTAQRVRQAIVAWWNGITGVFGRDLVTSTNNTDARSKLGLGTSATRNVGTAAGNVMEVGAFGLGHGSAVSSTYPSVPAHGAQVVHYLNPGVPGPLGIGNSDRTSYLEMNSSHHRTTIVSDGSSLYFSWVYNKAPVAGDFKKLLTATDLPATATRWPSYEEVTGKPANYPTTWGSVASKPAQATRWPTFAEVTGKPANYPTTWAEVAAKPVQATRWPTWAEVTGKPSIDSIGVGQTWQNMTASRAKGTTYTNSTGIPIQILVTYRDSGSDSGATFSIGSLTTTTADLKGRLEYQYWFSAVIPNGVTYSISGGVALPAWWELR